MFGHLPRTPLALLPTPLERGPLLASGQRLWLKRDDLTGLGMGGNKVRKLEFLCGDAVEAGARSLVTVGAAQSNHCRLTAAAGAVLGIEVHLVLSGDRPEHPTGNQLLSALFGAQLHYTGARESHWGELMIAADALADQLAADGAAPYAIPIGGSTATGALGYAVAFVELMEQCAAIDLEPAVVVHTSSSGGTHAGLVAGRALWRALGHHAPDVLAIGVAKGVTVGFPDIVELAGEALEMIGPPARLVTASDVHVDPDWLGDDYAVPTDDGDDAMRWAATTGGWVLDRTYTAKGMAGLLGNAANGLWPSSADVIFLHTGGMPAVFAPGGTP